MKDCSVTDDDIVEIYKRIGQNVKKVRTSKNISQLALSLHLNNVYKWSHQNSSRSLKAGICGRIL